MSLRYDGTIRMISFVTDDEGTGAVDVGEVCVAFCD